MKRAMCIFGTAALIAGCAGVNKSMEYNSAKRVDFSSPELPHGFQMYDKPSEGRMLVVISAGASIAKGAVAGATLGIADISTSEGTIQKAAQLWLNSTGRKCSVTGARTVLAPTNYEASYSCS